MILVRLNGGLGNQLFQYAAGKALADYHSVELKLDISTFKNNKFRVYELDHFAVTASIATSDEINPFTFENRPVYVRFLKKFLQRTKPHYQRSIYREPHFNFDTDFFKASDNTYLGGYWQSEKYFHQIAPVIRKEFKVTQSLKGRNTELAEKIQNSNSVCMHIRRGDYVSVSRIRDIHGVCSPDYYIKTVERIKIRTASPHFFIFSDDISWVKSNIKMADPTTFVDHNSVETAYEDFRLMSLCKNHIIANSSFSWWSAWLSESSNKIVVVPSKWFNCSERNTQDLIPEEWLKI